MPRRHLLSFALVGWLAGCGAPTDVCKSVAGTCAAVHVTGDHVAAVEQMRVTLSGAITGGPKVTPSTPSRQALPIDVAVSLPPSASGEVTVDIVALVAGDAVAHGSGRAMVSGGAHVKVEVTLTGSAPVRGDDFATPPTDNPDLAGADASTGGAHKELGSVCGDKLECKSGFCVDGVCCEGACDDACNVCNLTGHAGRCVPALNGAQPLSGHGSCGPDSASTCKRDGSCDGKGACRLWSSSAVCKVGSCNVNTNSFTPESRCDGAGSCATPQPITCAPFVCKSDLTACFDKCTDGGQCQPPNVCSNSSCGAKGNGATCSSDNECKSTHCIDKVCCATDCNGPCVACNLTPGTCTPVAANDPDPRGLCGTQAQSTCGNNGKCDGNGVCQKWTQGTSCASPTCANNAPQSHACDGKGTCVTATASGCSPYKCDAGACLSGQCVVGHTVPPIGQLRCDPIDVCASGCTCHQMSNEEECYGVCACP